MCSAVHRPTGQKVAIKVSVDATPCSTQADSVLTRKKIAPFDHSSQSISFFPVMRNI